MGIQGLLPAIKSITRPIHVKEYADKTVAVDTYSWLHKGAFTCCKELCEGQPTVKYVDYCMRKVNLLRYHGVKPLLVFDGGLLPTKAEQEVKRARTRKENLDRAREHELSGNRSAAYESYQKAVDITPSIALGLIEVLRMEGIDFIVAPYEADAQLAFLCLQGLVDAVITEDSDLVAYCCPKVLFKMDKYGQGDEFQFENIGKNKDLNFTSFTKQMVLEMCVLSGCDYLSSLQGMGLKKAYGLIKRFKCYQKAIKHLRFSGITISKEYEEKFEKAVLTFQHQRVYDPVKEDIVHVTDIPIGLGLNLDFLGPWLPQSLVKDVAKGVVDPLTLKAFEVQNSIIYSSKVQGNIDENEPIMTEPSRKKQIKLPLQKNLLTNYFIPASTASKQQFKAPRSMLESPELAETFENDPDNFPAKNYIKLDSMLGRASDVSQVVPSCITLLKEPMKEQVFKTKSLENIEPYQLHDGSETVPTFDVLVCSKSFVSGRGQQSPFLLKHSSVKRATSFDDRKSHKVVIRSDYFSCNALKSCDANKKRSSTVLNEESETMDEQDETLMLDTSQGNENDNLEPVTSTFVDKIEQMGYQSKKGSVKIGSKIGDAIVIAQNKHVPTFSSHLLIDLTNKQNLSNLSHLDQYAGIAKRSVDQFVSSISSFQCAVKGSRMSGLRPPQLSSLRSSRKFSKTTPNDPDFTKFTYDNDVALPGVCIIGAGKKNRSL